MNIKQKIYTLPEVFRHLLIKIISIFEIITWIIKDKPLPLPHKLKIDIISNYALRFNTKIFIETGTYLGQTIDDLKNLFESIYSIELDKKLYIHAKKIFTKNKSINILQGDSSIILPKILNLIKKPTLFWLDAHYSKGITAKGKKETPIINEINTISRSRINNHVILIDDAREFTGKNDYPKISDLKKLIHRKFKNYKITINNDIIQIYSNES